MNQFLARLAENFRNKKSLLCVGLDVDLEKIPEKFKKNTDPLFSFNKFIIDQTKEFTACYKPNMAFYERYGLKGLKSLYKTLAYLKKNKLPVILDAKRGDIGNTSQAYAKAVFEDFAADAVTLAPYMGTDSVAPFLEFRDKFAYVLCLTSNKGAQDFQKPELYKKVAGKIKEWQAQYQNCGAVVGATNAQEIKEIRELLPEVHFLIPGIGAQGGDLENTVRLAKDRNGSGFVINSSRGIIYAADPAAEARKLRDAIHAALQV